MDDASETGARSRVMCDDRCSMEMCEDRRSDPQLTDDDRRQRGVAVGPGASRVLAGQAHPSLEKREATNSSSELYLASNLYQPPINSIDHSAPSLFSWKMERVSMFRHAMKVFKNVKLCILECKVPYLAL